MDHPNSSPLTASPPVPEAGGARLWARLVALPPARQALLAGGLVLLVAMIGLLALRGARPDYRVLFSNLSDKDGGAIVAQLGKMNVPYRFSEGGGAVLVPVDQVHDVRLKLAQSGLPKGSIVGFELMDSARFGTTQFQERLNFQRGLEGELVRSITVLSAVESARVHLALPNQNGFFRDQQKPSASVLLTLRGGQPLDRAQVAGIVHLVSASVPEMDSKSVSVLDQSGAMLSGEAEEGPDRPAGHQARHIEALYTRRILDILEPVVGRDNLRTQVSVELVSPASEGIRRLTVAVVVNHRATTDSKGGVQSLPLPSEDIDKLQALVQDTVGFSQARGDSVKVINAPFKGPASDTDSAEGLPLWQRPKVLEMVRTLAEPLVLGLLGLALVFSVIQPVLRRLWLDMAVEPSVPPVARLDAVIGDMATVSSESDPRLDAVRDRVRQHPASVARTLSGWQATDEQGPAEAAVLLIAMGEEGAADVLRHLGPRDVQRLGEAMARTRSITRDRYERVLVRFESQVAADAQGLVEFGLDTGDYVRNVLHRALGQDKARLLLDRIVGTAPVPGLDSLKWMDPVTVSELLRQESPQIVAVILVHLEPDQASAVLQHFPPTERNEVMIRMATLDGVRPVALQELGDVLTRVLAGGEPGSRPPRGGLRTAAEVLDHMDTGAETAVLEYIRSADADLARRLSDHLPSQFAVGRTGDDRCR